MLPNLTELDVIAPGIEAYSGRAQAETMTGERPAPYDPTKPIKKWRLNPLPDGMSIADGMTYDYLSRDEKTMEPIIRQMSMSVVDAMQWNFPGEYGFLAYDKWAAQQPAPDAMRSYELNGVVTWYAFNPSDKPLFLLLEQAEALATELAGELSALARVVEAKEATGYRFGADEQRRVYDIELKHADGTVRYAAGYLWRDRSASGVPVIDTSGPAPVMIAPPGSWAFTGPESSLRWISNGPPTGPANVSIVPYPIVVPEGYEPGESVHPMGGRALFLVPSEKPATSGIDAETRAAVLETREMVKYLKAREEARNL